MSKKQYQPPTITKVRLEIKNAVLANCNNSPNLTPKNGGGIPGPCTALSGCFYPD